MTGKKIILFLLFPFVFLFCTCKELSDKTVHLELYENTSPIDLSNLKANFYKNLSYGNNTHNTFDIFLPGSKVKTPLVIFVHGGGFIGGDKNKAYKGDYPEHIRSFLKNNIAFAAINYRFITDPSSQGVITSLNDSKRCLQFIRYHAKELNIDKDEIGMYGSSAGSGTSLWLGFHDDMKIFSSDDPIERESTRLKAVGALETQATYDLVKWATVVFKPFNFSLEEMAASGMQQTIQSFYHINSLDEINSEKMKTYRKDIDFLSLMSYDDPPIWVKNEKYGAQLPKSQKEINHHPLHAKALKEQAGNIGLSAMFYIPKLNIEDSTNIDIVQFMINNFNLTIGERRLFKKRIN